MLVENLNSVDQYIQNFLSTDQAEFSIEELKIDKNSCKRGAVVFEVKNALVKMGNN